MSITFISWFLGCLAAGWIFPNWRIATIVVVTVMVAIFFGKEVPDGAFVASSGYFIYSVIVTLYRDFKEWLDSGPRQKV